MTLNVFNGHSSVDVVMGSNVFTHGVWMGGRAAGKIFPGQYPRNHKV